MPTDVGIVPFSPFYYFFTTLFLPFFYNPFTTYFSL